MEFLLNRYRNLTVLLLVIVVQLLLLAYQVKSNQDVRLIRVWAVTAVTPMAGIVEAVRRNTVGFLQDYFILLDVRDENRRLRSENGRLKMDNQYLKTELSTADRAHALSAFQRRTPSKMIAARIIGNGTGATSKVVFVDRGTSSGVAKGMAVVTPDGIAGKVLASYPTAAQVLLITDATFAAGVISQKHRVHGTLKGQGHSTALVDYVQNEEKVEVGEWFYTSGDDLVFPKGLPVGQANVVRPGKTFKDIYMVPSGLQNGLEEVLIVMEGVHQSIPETPIASAPVHLLTAPPPEPGSATVASDGSTHAPLNTDADHLRDQYKRLGEEQKHAYGETSPPPNFLNLDRTGSRPVQKPPVPAKESVVPKPLNPGESAAPHVNRRPILPLGARPTGSPIVGFPTPETPVVRAPGARLQPPPATTPGAVRSKPKPTLLKPFVEEQPPQRP